ncbi:MAG TPA: L,D-transpeptidase [Gaiellaceae bacterium]|jgi:lipoprotein-anchoring transpeptidase ErfK/SrfK|nr:L,D-transpeptidase [Gaiellaceae bacterium]
MSHISNSQINATRVTRGAGFLALGALAALLLLPSAGASPTSKSKESFPHLSTLTNAKIGHWAPVVRVAGAHFKPSASSYVITRLPLTTSDGTQNVVLILSEDDVSPSQVWYKVRLPILPNNSTGWVPKSALGNVYIVHTHLYVDRAKQTLVLKKDGKTIFSTRVGVGKTAPGWGPTPPGQYYIRDKLTNFNDPFYGPVAFGTSARSAVLTEWPGGGFVGVHGTNEPGLIPGYISHGCIRLVNTAILKLAKLMSVGTPLTVT